MSSAMSNILKLKRIIYLTENGLKYIAGNPEQHFLKDFNRCHEVVTSLLSNQEDTNEFIDIIKAASEDDLLPRRVTLFYILAFAMTKINMFLNDEVRIALAEAVMAICKSDEEFFKFISIFTLLNKSNTKNKITTAMGGVVRKYLEKKTVLEYADSVGKAKGYHGWKFKDLIKLAHYKSTCIEKTMIATYVLFGLEKLKDQNSTLMKKIYEILSKWEKLRKTEDMVEAGSLISELHANFNQVNPKLIQSQEVWSAIIPELPTREVLKILPKLYKCGMLKTNSLVHNKVVDALTSLENIKKSKLNPLEVFMYMKDFEKGGKPLDPKLESYLKSKIEDCGEAKELIAKVRMEPNCSVISSSLGRCLNLAYPKDPYTIGMGKKIVLALDLTEQSDAVCFKNKNITCLEAELALALYYCKTEKNINITVFNNKDVKGFNLDKSAPFLQNLKKLKENRTEYMTLAAVFDWASSKKKVVDLFICIVQNWQSLHKAPKDAKAPAWHYVHESLVKYQKRMSSPNSKLVLICLGSHNLAPLSNNNSLTVCGFSPEIPKVVKAFASGTFQ